MSKVLPLVQFFNVEDLSREVVSSFTNTVSENINKGNSNGKSYRDFRICIGGIFSRLQGSKLHIISCIQALFTKRAM
jgi:hypothetical protein